MDQGYTLDQPYLTDPSSVYHIAMILHPGMKLEYFCKQCWLKM
jgi:hypothetical protein